MTLEDQITALCAEAEPLRGLAEDDPAKAALCGIVERINLLRDMQARGLDPGKADPIAALYANSAMPKRKPGRPPKARIEGDDA